MILPGRYLARATTVGWWVKNENTAQERQYFTATFTVDDGEYKGEAVEYYGWMTEKARDRTITALKNMGWNGEGVLPKSGLENQVEVTVEEDTYKGVSRMRVAWVNEVGGTSQQHAREMTDKELTVFSATLMSRIKSLNLGASNGRPEQTKPDAIPF